ncbi:unnamed protein product [Sphagnum tenellum]
MRLPYGDSSLRTDHSSSRRMQSDGTSNGRSSGCIQIGTISGILYSRALKKLREVAEVVDLLSWNKDG